LSKRYAIARAASFTEEVKAKILNEDEEIENLLGGLMKSESVLSLIFTIIFIGRRIFH